MTDPHMDAVDGQCPICGGRLRRDHPHLAVLDATCSACGWHTTSAQARAALARKEAEMDIDDRIEAALTARYDALLASLRSEAADAFNHYIEAHRAEHPDEPPHQADEIEAINVAEGGRYPEWYVSSKRETVNDLGHGVPEPDAARALLRFIAWAKAEAGIIDPNPGNPGGKT